MCLSQQQVTVRDIGERKKKLQALKFGPFHIIIKCMSGFWSEYNFASGADPILHLPVLADRAPWQLIPSCSTQNVLLGEPYGLDEKD